MKENYLLIKVYLIWVIVTLCEDSYNVNKPSNSNFSKKHTKDWDRDLLRLYTSDPETMLNFYSTMRETK